MTSTGPSSSEPPRKLRFRDTPNYRIITLLLPRIPLIFYVFFLHLFRISEHSKYLDVKSNLTLHVLRDILTPSSPRSVGAIQRLTLHDSGIKGKLWVSKYVSPIPPEDDVRAKLIQAVEGMKDRATTEKCRAPSIEAVEAEWTGYRPNVSHSAALPSIPEEEKYKALVKDTTTPVTVLYIHGGAFYLCDPSTHRATTSRLARVSGGKVYSVRYRLAPQGVFPDAVLDALISWLTLLYPPPGAFHEAIRPEHAVFAGDSAGGNLALALIQLLLQFQRQKIAVTWYGKSRTIPLPASVAVSSPWLEVTQSLPCWSDSYATPFDYLPKPSSIYAVGIRPDAIWPANPPRQHLYVDDAMATHPLVSLVMAEDWRGTPPVFMTSGWEILNYEHKWFAQKLAAQGIQVRYEEWEAMPHCFAQVYVTAEGSRRFFKAWGDFIQDSVMEPEKAVRTRTVLIRARTFVEEEQKFEELTKVTDEEVREYVREHAKTLPQSLVASPKL